LSGTAVHELHTQIRRLSRQRPLAHYSALTSERPESRWGICPASVYRIRRDRGHDGDLERPVYVANPYRFCLGPPRDRRLARSLLL